MLSFGLGTHGVGLGVHSGWGSGVQIGYGQNWYGRPYAGVTGTIPVNAAPRIDAENPGILNRYEGYYWRSPLPRYRDGAFMPER